MKLHLLFFAALAPLFPAVASAQNAPVRLEIPMGAGFGVEQPPRIPANGPGLVVTLKTEGGKTQDVWVPLAFDIGLQRDPGDKSNPAGAYSYMGAARWGFGLYRLDWAEFERVTKGAPIEKASVRIRANVIKPTRDAPLKMTFHRMLRTWSDNATWRKPDPKAANWDGLAPGKDFEAEPLATHQGPPAKGGFAVGMGFEKAIAKWRSKEWPDFGFMMQIAQDVKADGEFATTLQVLTLEGAVDKPPTILGGAWGGKVVARFNAPLVRRVVLTPADVQAATLQFSTRKPAAAVLDKEKAAVVKVYRLLREVSPKDSLQAGRDYQAEPLVTRPLLEALKTIPAATATGRSRDVLEISGLQSALAPILSAKTPDFGLLIEFSGLQDAAKVALSVATPGVLNLSLKRTPPAQLFEAAVVPRTGVYATVKNGHIFYGDQRLRLWGVAAPQRNLETIERVKNMGFNAWRLWSPRGGYNVGAPRQGTVLSPEEQAALDKRIAIVKSGKMVEGKGSGLDEFDIFMAEIKRQGMFIHSPAPFASSMWSEAKELMLAGDSFIAGGADWNAWKTAIEEKGANYKYLSYFDERVQKMLKTHAANFLNRVNPYTGQKYADNENIVIYELANEYGFLKRVLGDPEGFNKFPPYFRDKLRGKWNDFLKAKYRDEAGLKTAWGKVNEGETLGTVALAPLFPQRLDYPKAREADFMRFLIGLVDAWNQEFRAHCRAQGTPGKGVAVVPFIFDTQHTPSMPWLYAGALGDVTSAGSYQYALSSSLTIPPAFYMVDSHLVENKPTILYEVQVEVGSPVRAEFPIRLAAMASFQDLDGVFWHYWNPIGGDGTSENEDYLAVKLHEATSGLEFANDPIRTSSIALAGHIFRHQLLKTAPNPQNYELGGQAIFGYDFFNGITLPAYTTGGRIRFAPEKASGLLVNGQEVVPERISEAVKSGDETTWDWPNGRLLIDSPFVKAYVGPAPAATGGLWKFKDGITVGNFSTPWVTWAMVSADGKPLVGQGASGKVYITALANAVNTDFEFDWSIAQPGGAFMLPAVQGTGVKNKGEAPIVADKVSYDLWFPNGLQGRFSGVDFALRPNIEKPLNGNKISGGTPADAPRELWMQTLQISGRGTAMATPEVREVAVPVAPPKPGTGLTTTAKIDPDLAKLWHPMRGTRWSDDYLRVHQRFRDEGFVWTSLSKEDYSAAPQKSIQVTDADFLFKQPANVDMKFQNGLLQSLTATFKNPPDFGAIVAQYEKEFGPATEKKIAADVFNPSNAKWTLQSGPYTLQIEATALQGNVGLSFKLGKN